AMANGPLEGQMQDAATPHAVEIAKLGLEVRDLSGGPLRHDRRVEVAKLRDVEQRPGALRGGRRRRLWKPVDEIVRNVREVARIADLSRGRAERRTLEQQPDSQISAQSDRQIARGHAVGPLFDLKHDAGPSTQRQEFGGQIRLPSILADAERRE